MFKRPRLRATSPLVNAGSALALLFLASACGPSPEPAEYQGDTPADSSAENAPQTEDALSLPAVWNTSALDTPIQSLAVAGEFGSIVAAAYEDGHIQFFDFNADRITQKIDLGIQSLADGRYVQLSGTPVTLFPAIAQSGDMQILIYGDGMSEPLPYELDVENSGSVAGLCSAPPLDDSDGILRLGFWTEDAPRELKSGRIIEVGDQLIFLADEPVEAPRAITACVLERLGATVFSAPIQNAAVLARAGTRQTVTLDTSGNYARLRATSGDEALTIRDGMSVIAPPVPSAMTATGDARAGGYSGGLMLVAGEVGDGDYRITFVDPSDITLSALGIPAAPGE